MRLDPFHVLVPLIVAAAAVFFLALDTSASLSCDGPQDRFDAGQVEQAQKELKTILKEEPDSDCAKELMASVRKSIAEDKWGEPKTIVIQGVDGKDGKDGTDGTPGNPGKDGADGAPGKDGARGPAGPSGPPGKREVIVVDGKG
jgi:hypothetical protein